MKTKISIIGGGNMGAAIIAGIRKQYSVSVCEQDKKRSRWLKQKYKVSVGDLKTVTKRARVLILAVKPQHMDRVLKKMKPFITKSQLVISIAAGITCQYIEKRLGSKTRVVRTMPNLGAQVGAGMTGICSGKYATRADLNTARLLFGRVGQTVVVGEKSMDAITSVSGSGPAYVFYFVEVLRKAATSLGLKKKLSEELIVQTIKGSLGLMDQQKVDVSVLRKRVTSKGGTTEAALNVLNKQRFDKTFQTALKAAAQRAKKLSK